MRGAGRSSPSTPRGWTFVFVYLILTLLRAKAYFLAPAYPILFASGAVVLERKSRPELETFRIACELARRDLTVVTIP